MARKTVEASGKLVTSVTVEVHSNAPYDSIDDDDEIESLATALADDAMRTLAARGYPLSSQRVTG